ncbi:hypothetical protein [Actinomadura violacea]|uniref:DUF3307 domain-containing protein n=1 Tax=Actinomadura violacea TaxID=2819934 RepID=A0ABS3S6F9_9ACTN|nr:hypothetical protein [Actinomadura violacea]MBO2464584.1 hypothetical protein [Actinomadura violacea]
MGVLSLLVRAATKRLDQWKWSSCGSVAGKVQHGAHEGALLKHAALHTAFIAVAVFLAWAAFSDYLFINWPGFVVGQGVVFAGHVVLDVLAYSRFKSKCPWVLVDEKMYVTKTGDEPPTTKTEQTFVKRTAETNLHHLVQLVTIAAILTVVVTRGTI